MADVIEFQNRLVRSLSGDSQVQPPPQLLPFHQASPVERRRRCRFVLANAFLIWRRGGISLTESVREAAAGTAAGEYALIEMRHVLCELNLPAWETHPHRVRADVHRLFRKTIGRLTPHRGGWHVRPPKSA